MTNAFPRKSSRLLWSSLSVALFLALMAPQRAEAQVLYGSVVGHVTDPSGAAVPGAKVHIINKDTGISKVALTDSVGDYSLIDVVAGTYTVEVSREGFKRFAKSGVSVTINAVARVDVSMEVGTVTQEVMVSAEAPTLQTDTSEVHADVDAPILENIPVPLGRNYQQIYRALPGFSPPQNSHSIPTNPARSLSFNVNGTSNNQNNTRIDGVSTYNVQLPHVNSYVPTLDSIQEVNVVTDSFDAEQGFAGGAAINVQTKSGTNQYHGDLFEYHSNNHLKAWPMQFDNAAVNVGNKPKFVFNDFGGAVGGPIKKNKLFFFASYEGLYNHRELQRVANDLTQGMRNGDLSPALTAYDCLLNGSIETNATLGCPPDGSTPILVRTAATPNAPSTLVQAQDGMVFDPATGNPITAANRQVWFSMPADNAACTSATGCLNVIPTALLDPSAQKILSPSLVPLPNRAGTHRNYFVSGPFGFNRNQVDTKIDFNASSKLNFIGTLGVLHYSSLAPTIWGDKALGRTISGSGGTSNPGHGSGNTYRTTVLGSYIFSPNFLMDAHFGYAKQGTQSVQAGLGTNIGRDVLGIPGTNGTRNFESGWPEFDFSGFDTIGIDSNFMPYYRHDPQFQYVANFNWVKGTHNIRFGTDAYRQGLNQTQAESLSGSYGAQGGFMFGRGLTDSCYVVNPDGSCGVGSNDTRFNSAGAFILGTPDTIGRNLQVPDVYHVHAWLFSTYVRDRWNVSPKLTLDYGTRWEYYPVPRRDDRGIERYDPTTNKVLVCGTGGVPSDCGVQISKRLFAPRAGFAYRATDTFVVRGGYGITFDPYEFMELLRNNYPVSVPLTLVNSAALFPAPAGTLSTATPLYGPLAAMYLPSLFPGFSAGVPPLTPPNPSTGTIPLPGDVTFGAYPKKFDRGYVESWNFTVQKQLRWGLTGQVAYVGTQSIRELGFFDINSGQVIGGGSSGEPLFAQYGRTAQTINVIPVGTGHYNSLQASLQRRFKAGLALTVNYTYGKSIDMVDNSDENPGNDDGRFQILKYMYLNRARAGYDRTQNLEIMHVWNLPFGKGERWLGNSGRGLSYLVSGWQLSGLLSAITGPPFTVYASGAAFNTPGSSQTADQVKTHVAKTGAVDPNIGFYDPTAFVDVNSARLGNSGFNILDGPGIFNYDFGVYREFSLSERYKLQFRASSFNFTNTPHFNTPEDGYACVCDGIPGPPGSPNFGNSFMTVTTITNLAREGIDERQFEFGLKLLF